MRYQIKAVQQKHNKRKTRSSYLAARTCEPLNIFYGRPTLIDNSLHINNKCNTKTHFTY